MGRVRCFSHVVASPLEIGGAGCGWVVFNWCLVLGDGESVLSGFLGGFFFALVLGLLAGWLGGLIWDLQVLGVSIAWRVLILLGPI